MSELALYVVATIVVLAGVAYFFIKQREQEALAQSKSAKRNEPKKQKAKKETKEPREVKPRKPRVVKEEQAPAPLTKKAEKRREREEDETKNVLTFLKGKKFSSEQASGQSATQAKVRSAPPPVEKREAKPQYSSEEESGSDTEDYEKVKRKIKTTSTKEKPSEVEAEEPKKGKKKPKFFTKQEADEYEATQKAAKDARAKNKADWEARKNMTPEEKKAAAKARRIAERAAEKAAQAEDGEFTTVRERRSRKERTEGDNEDDTEGDDRRKSRFPAREPDQAPVFAAEYEAADMDNILNNLTQYYKSNPDAHRPKQPRARKPAAAEPEESKAESE